MQNRVKDCSSCYSGFSIGCAVRDVARRDILIKQKMIFLYVIYAPRAEEISEIEGRKRKRILNRSEIIWQFVLSYLAKTLGNQGYENVPHPINTLVQDIRFQEHLF